MRNKTFKFKFHDELRQTRHTVVSVKMLSLNFQKIFSLQLITTLK